MPLPTRPPSPTYGVTSRPLVVSVASVVHYCAALANKDIEKGVFETLIDYQSM